MIATGYRKSIFVLIVSCAFYTMPGLSQPIISGPHVHDQRWNSSITPAAAFTDSPYIDQTPQNTPKNIGDAQGRILCPPDNSPYVDLGDHPTNGADFLKNHYKLALATLALGCDTAITVRHMFEDENGNQTTDPSRCYFIHLGEHQAYRVSKGVYSQPTDDEKRSTVEALRFNDDAAWIKLDQSIQACSFIPLSQIQINSNLTKGQTIVGRYSYSASRPDGYRNKPTIVYGKIMEMPEAEHVTNVYGAAISDGGGSSGGLVFDSDGKDAKWIGLLTAEKGGEQPADEPWTTNGHNTLVTTFGRTLMSNYNRLQSGSQ